MGIGDAGVDIGASVDRIESRSVSTARLLPFVGGRRSGREEGRRPQSLVSLSGSSSSGSTASSSSTASSNSFPGVVFRHQPPLQGSLTSFISFF